MLESVYIATKSGLCLFSRHYILGTIDDDTITGLTTAMYHMSDESLKDSIQDIVLKRKRIYFQIKDPLIVILVTETQKKKKYQKMSKKILKTFIKRYPIIFSNNILSPTFFKDFEKIIDSLR